MKLLFGLLAFSVSQLCFAQEEQVACMRKFDEQFSAAGTEMTNLAGSLNYKALMERATQCIQGGRCIKVELVIAMSELMVDEEVIMIQREKVSKLKEYLSENRTKFMSNDYCAVMATFPAVIAELRALNNSQLERFKVLMRRDLEPLLRSER
jgi:hypothetical protein